MQRFKSFVLPVALVLGYFLRELCAVLSVAVPYVIFTILLLTFSGVRIASLRPSRLDGVLAAFQAVVSIALFFIIEAVSGDRVIAQGAMMCVLCPVASSVTVVATMLEANAVRTTTYTLVGNLLVAAIAPLYISIAGEAGEGSDILQSFLLILYKIAMVIALPVGLVWLMQKCAPAVNSAFSKYKHLSFYLWAFALFVTIGQTADFVIDGWTGDAHNVLWLGIVSLAICVVQFAVGRKIGKRYGDTVAGGQLLAQKNSAMGIWMINTFLNPVASVALACYSIFQNIFNSYQLYRTNRR